MSVPIKILVLSMPTRLHIFPVAYGLSPVKILVVTPISFNLFKVSFTSFFAGSRNATNPIKVISFSSEMLNTFTPLYSLFDAKAITCIP